MTDAFIYDAVRTPRGRGKADGSLHEVTALNLATQALGAIKDRNELDTGAGRRRGARLRRSGRRGGRRHRARRGARRPATATRSPGVQINRFCASGLDAVNFAAAQVMSGQHDMTIGGGVESMSRVGIGASGGAWPMDPAIAVPTYFLPQGISADLIATKYGFSRDDVDAYAVESQKRAARPLGRRQLQELGRAGEGRERPHHPRPGRAHAADHRHAVARRAQAVVRADGRDGRLRRGRDAGASGGRERSTHVHHAGNSSGIVDGAAAVLLGNKEAGKARSA